MVDVSKGFRLGMFLQSALAIFSAREALYSLKFMIGIILIIAYSCQFSLLVLIATTRNIPTAT
jgi:hypothetical protein